MGTSLCKGGYSGEDTPKAVFPTDYGVANAPGDSNGDAIMGGAEDGKRRRYIGDSEVICPRANMEIKNPLSGGLICDWDAMEHLWDHMFKTQLRVNVQEVSFSLFSLFLSLSFFSSPWWWMTENSIVRLLCSIPFCSPSHPSTRRRFVRR